VIPSVTLRQLLASPISSTHHCSLEVQSVMKHGACLPVLDFDKPRAFRRTSIHCALSWGLPPRWWWLDNSEDQA